MAGGVQPSKEEIRARADEIRRNRETLATKAAADAQANPPPSVVLKDTETVRRAREARDTANYDAASERLIAQGKTWGETGEDAARSFAKGAEEGVISTPGSPFDIIRFGQMSRAKTQELLARYTPFSQQYADRPYEAILEEQDEERRQGKRGFGWATNPETLENWGGESYVNAARPYVPGMSHRPETATGRAANVVGNFVGSAATGGSIRGGERAAASFMSNNGDLLTRIYGAGARGTASMAPEIVRQGVVPAAATLATQQLTDDPFTQTLAAVGSGAVAGRNSRTAEDSLRKVLPGVTDAEMNQAEALFNDARGRGLNITRLQAIDQVTGGRTGGTELQRLVESTGDPTLREYFAGAGENIRPAATAVLNQVAQPPRNPSMIGPDVAQSMSGNLTQARENVNAQVGPRYDQFQTAPVDQALLDAARQNPHWAATEQTVMNDPRYASYLQTTSPPGSVGYMDLVNRVQRGEMETLNNPLNPQANPTAAGGIAPQLRTGEQIASMASRQLPPGQGIPIDPATGQPMQSPLEAAQQQRAIGQQTLVDPLLAGPEGQAARAATTEGVTAALLPKSPLEGSQHEVERAFNALPENQRRDVLRQHLGTELNRGTTTNLEGEVPYTGGAKFMKGIMGNPQQRTNLQTAFNTLPGGHEIFTGLDRLNEVFEAMARRKHPGSRTAFNEQDLADMKGRGMSDAAIKALGSAGLNWPTMVKETLERWRLGQATDEIARVSTDPAMAAEFRTLARVPRGSVQQVAAVRRLMTVIAMAGARDAGPLPSVQQQISPVVDDPGTKPLVLRIPGRKQ